MADARRVAVIALAALLLGGCGVSGSLTTGAHEMTGTVLDPPFAVEATALTDGTGAPYSLVGDTDKELTLVFFGYTHCPDICGIVMSTLAASMTRLDEAERDDVDVVFITTDPARDTPKLAAEYATNFNKDFIGLSGPLETIVDVAKPLGIAIEKGDKLPSGGYEVGHGTQIVAVNAADEGIAYWNEDVSPAQLSADMRYLLEQQP